MLHNTFGSLLCTALLFQDSVLASPRRPQKSPRVERRNNIQNFFGSDEIPNTEVAAPNSSSGLLQNVMGDSKDFLVEAKDNIIAVPKKIVQGFAPDEVPLLHDSIIRLGTDEELLVEALALKSNAEMTTLKQAYQTEYQRDLENDIDGDTSGDVKRFFVAMIAGSRDETGSTSTVDADVDALYAAANPKKWLFGLGTDESVFINVLTSKSYEHLAAVSQAYSAKHGKAFTDVIKGEFSGTIEKVLVAFVEAFEDYPTYLANRLERTMKGVGTNEKRLKSLVSRIFLTGRMGPVKAAYLKKYGKSLVERVKGDTSGILRLTLTTMIGGN